MPETPAFLADRLRSEGEKCAAFFAALPPAQWQVEVYADGALWTVRSLLAHFVEAERGFLDLFERIRQGGAGVADDFSIDRYNAEGQQRARRLTPAELLDHFTSVRAQMVAWVASLSEDDLRRQARHPFLGQAALAEMIKMVYRHNQIHLRDLPKRIAGA